jgi:hypothetical protein
MRMNYARASKAWMAPQLGMPELRIKRGQIAVASRAKRNMRRLAARRIPFCYGFACARRNVRHRLSSTRRAYWKSAMTLFVDPRQVTAG